jgi:hypothetical protein
MAEHSDSEISLSDDEVYQLLEADEVPGAGFTATYRGGVPFQFGSDPRLPGSKDVQVVSSILTLLVVLTN